MTYLNIVLEQLRAADASRLMRVHNCSSECHVVLERHMNNKADLSLAPTRR